MFAFAIIVGLGEQLARVAIQDCRCARGTPRRLLDRLARCRRLRRVPVRVLCIAGPGAAGGLGFVPRATLFRDQSVKRALNPLLVDARAVGGGIWRSAQRGIEPAYSTITVAAGISGRRRASTLQPA